jgi:hypothetical protein
MESDKTLREDLKSLNERLLGYFSLASLTTVLVVCLI